MRRIPGTNFETFSHVCESTIFYSREVNKGRATVWGGGLRVRTEG